MLRINMDPAVNNLSASIHSMLFALRHADSSSYYFTYLPGMVMVKQHLAICLLDTEIGPCAVEHA